MEDLKIEYIEIDKITPYKNNTKKHKKKDVDAIKKSIKEFGMNDPIGIWGDKNIIVEGHGRLIASKELGYKKVPCIRLDNLNEEQRKAYTIAHNKITELSEWDFDLLDEEMQDILNIDMSDFGFEFVDPEEEHEKHKNQELRTDRAYNLIDFDPERTEGKYQMPILEPCNKIPKRLIGFNYAMSSTDYKAGIHFYLDDYQFERFWNQPDKYVDILQKFDVVLTPSYSLYMDMAEPIKIYNIFRSRLLGQKMQDNGIDVIPIVYWADENSFDYCFDGLPSNATLSTLTMGTSDPEVFAVWKKGMDELIKRKSPKCIILYGNGLDVDYDFGNIKVVYFTNEVTERMKETVKRGK